MKAFLMHPGHDFDTERELPANEPVLSQDLELNTLVSAMAAGDAFLFEIARRAVLSSLRDPDAIAYRQEILKDALGTPSVIRDLYALAGEALADEKSVWGSLLRDSPRTMLGTSVRKMEVLVAALRRLREIADQHAEKFRSPGLCRFFAMLTEELGDEYFELIEGYLKELNFKGGPLLSARLTTGNKGTGYTLRRPGSRASSTACSIALATASPSPTATRQERAPSASWRTEASTSSAMRSRSRAITCSASSSCCASRSASTSHA